MLVGFINVVGNTVFTINMHTFSLGLFMELTAHTAYSHLWHLSKLPLLTNYIVRHSAEQKSSPIFI